MDHVEKRDNFFVDLLQCLSCSTRYETGDDPQTNHLVSCEKVRRSPGLVPAPIPDMRLRKSSRNDRSTSPTPLARRSTSPTTLARSQIRFEADPEMVCLRLQNHPECKKAVMKSIDKTCEEQKTNVQRVVTVRSLSKQVHVRDRRELREKMEEIKYRLPRFTRIN